MRQTSLLTRPECRPSVGAPEEPHRAQRKPASRFALRGGDLDRRMAKLSTVHRAADDVAPCRAELRLRGHGDLKTLRGPGTKARRPPHLELTANELRHLTAV